MELRKRLLSIGACHDAIEWVGDRELKQAWQDCHRGDWMCWLLKKANMCDLRTLTLIKARQASLVKHLMKDQRSLNALQAAFDFADGKISESELTYAAYDAAVAAYDASVDAADAAYDAADAAYAACNAAYAAAAKSEILRQCADIVRDVIPNPSIND